MLVQSRVSSWLPDSAVIGLLYIIRELGVPHIRLVAGDTKARPREIGSADILAAAFLCSACAQGPRTLAAWICVNEQCAHLDSRPLSIMCSLAGLDAELDETANVMR